MSQAEDPEIDPLDPNEVEAVLRESPRARALVRGLVDWLAAVLARVDAVEAQTGPAIEIGDEDEGPTRFLTLTLGGATTSVEVPDTGEEPEPARAAVPVDPIRVDPIRVDREAPALREDAPASPEILALVARRARLKAECCRWAITRRRRLADGADFEDAIRPVDKELVRRARGLARCHAWPLDPYAALPEDAQLEDLAAGYEALAAAADLTREVDTDEDAGPEFREDAYQTLAEAQSALRVGLMELAGLTEDHDYTEAFNWLRRRAYREQVYVPRYMKLQDRADPTAWNERQERIDLLRERFERATGHRRQRTGLFNRIRYHGRRIAAAALGEVAANDWQRVDDSVRQLVETGLAPSNVELREILLPWHERMPDDFEPGAELSRALRELDRFLASRESQGPRERAAPPSAEVQRVAALLQGRRAVLIGGVERPRSREALERAFGLSELCWIATDSATSYTSFESEIAHPETALVMLAIRWSSHSYENVKEYCDRYGVPYVRLPAGYGPNRVAAEVLAQASERLAAT